MDEILSCWVNNVSLVTWVQLLLSCSIANKGQIPPMFQKKSQLTAGLEKSQPRNMTVYGIK